MDYAKSTHMEKPRTVFHEEGEDDVTMATTDATIAHIMDEQEDIEITSSKCWNPIRPPDYTADFKRPPNLHTTSVFGP
jgi:hypothetical protein